MLALEIAAAVCSAAGVAWLARRSRWGWPASLVGIALYAWIFASARLYADMLLQAVFAASCVYGWAQWRGRDARGTGAAGAVEVAVPGGRELSLGLLAGAVGAVGLAAAMARYTDASAPWLDAPLTAFSLVAQLWTARRYLQAWVLWLVLDVAYVGLFVRQALYPTALLYAAFVVIAAAAIVGWRRAARR